MTGSVLARRYTLATAAERFFPGTRVTANTLRRAIRKKKLAAVKISNQYLVTEEEIGAFIEASTVRPKDPPCPVVESRHASISVLHVVDAPHSGSFSTVRTKAARARAQMTLEKLKRPSSATS